MYIDPSLFINEGIECFSYSPPSLKLRMTPFDELSSFNNAEMACHP